MSNPCVSVHGFRFVPYAAILVPDNLRSGVTKAHRCEPDVEASYQDRTECRETPEYSFRRISVARYTGDRHSAFVALDPGGASAEHCALELPEQGAMDMSDGYVCRAAVEPHTPENIGTDRRAGARRRSQIGREGHLAEGLLGNLDAVYALACLSLGDDHDAEQLVVDAFIALFENATDRCACGPCAWRVLADHVHVRSEDRSGSPDAGTTPFRGGALSKNQREAVAFALVGREPRESARLLGVSLVELRQLLRSALKALRPVMLAIPVSRVGARAE
jgi:hypothetical protein